MILNGPPSVLCLSWTSCKQTTLKITVIVTRDPTGLSRHHPLLFLFPSANLPPFLGIVDKRQLVTFLVSEYMLTSSWESGVRVCRTKELNTELLINAESIMSSILRRQSHWTRRIKRRDLIV